MENKSTYEMPAVRIVEIAIEQGFAMSSTLQDIPEESEERW